VMLFFVRHGWKKKSMLMLFSVHADGNLCAQSVLSIFLKVQNLFYLGLMLVAVAVGPLGFVLEG